MSVPSRPPAAVPDIAAGHAGVRGRTRVSTLVMIATIALFFLSDARYQLVSLAWSDAVIILVLATVAGFWWTRRGLGTGDGAASRSQFANQFAESALILSFGLAGLLGLLNGILDGAPGSSFAGVVTRKSCHRLWCTFTVAGRPGPHVNPSIDIAAIDFVSPDATVGDSLDVQLKPGALGRPWIASYSVRILRGTAPQ